MKQYIIQVGNKRGYYFKEVTLSNELVQTIYKADANTYDVLEHAEKDQGLLERIFPDHVFKTKLI